MRSGAAAHSSRTLADVIYREELDRLAASGGRLTVYHTLTRDKPTGWQGYTRRVDESMMQEVAWPKEQMPAVSSAVRPRSWRRQRLFSSGWVYEPRTIKTERFGATGG